MVDFGHRSGLRTAYYDGVIDFLNIGTPSPAIYGEPGYSPRKSHELGQARKQGFRDAKEGRVLRGYEISPDRILRRAEASEAVAPPRTVLRG